MKNGRFIATTMALLIVTAFSGGAGLVRAQSPESAAAAGVPMIIEAQFVNQANGLEAGWGATGQILVPLPAADPALQRWRQARAVATSPSRQSVTLTPGSRGLIRVGREIPFAGWFLRHGTSCGWLEEGAEWREVESALEVETSPPAADGTVRLAFTPEFSFLAGRTRRTVAFPGERVEIVLAPGAEARFVPGTAREAFYGRLLAGYDPLRRVWPVDLVLRADPAESSASAEP
jgi:hypothetical protein